MKSIVLFAVFVLALASSGCTNSGPALPGLAKVSGTVTLDGKPMDGGEVRFNAPGVPSKRIEVKGGTFSGEVFPGKNQVDVVFEKDGGPHPMEPGKFLKVNTVDPKFWGPNTTLTQDIPPAGATDLKFEVTSSSE